MNAEIYQALALVFFSAILVCCLLLRYCLKRLKDSVLEEHDKYHEDYIQVRFRHAWDSIDLLGSRIDRLERNTQGNAALASVLRRKISTG